MKPLDILSETTVWDDASISEGVKPLDIVDKTSGQFPAMFVETEPGRWKTLVPKRNQIVSSALSQH